MHTPPDPLDPLLDRWAEPTDPAPNLAPEVWRRIELAERGARETGTLWGEVESWLSRPPFAVLFVTCCALVGLYLAEVRVNRMQREHSAELARSYLQLIDPLLNAGPAAKLP
ncbi:MAG TPA: hypothetical protein VKG78_05450 [Opitutaceae bacterium]|nr:hypothetical protein [Opitutaceae bacterium]